LNSSQTGLRGLKERGFKLMPPRRGLVPRVVGGITENDQGHAKLLKVPQPQAQEKNVVNEPN
jgi:hypothetical protein